MNQSFNELPNGYQETISRGIDAVRRFHGGFCGETLTREEAVGRLKKEIETADAILIGAGAGLSTAAGFVYTGDRFMKWFPDFIRTYGIRDMYEGGFYPYPSREIFWAYWARYIYVNRYLDPPKPVYEELLSLINGRDYFVITTNVDHCFQKAGFDKKRLFYTQGDYGLFQSTDPDDRNTDDNKNWIMRAMEAQGFVRNEEGVFEISEKGEIMAEIPTELIPRHPVSGKELTTNLRSDDRFVEDEGWYKASAAYADFIREHNGKHVLFLEIGVGNNTPVIIKYPFWQMTDENPRVFYACLNYSEAYCPSQIKDRSVCIKGDSGEVIREILRYDG